MFCMYNLTYCASAGHSIARLALLMAIMLIKDKDKEYNTYAVAIIIFVYSIDALSDPERRRLDLPIILVKKYLLL